MFHYEGPENLKSLSSYGWVIKETENVPNRETKPM